MRLTRDDDYFNLKQEHYYTDYRTEKLPRKVEYSVIGQSYFLMQFALDPYHYGLTDEDKLALIAEDSYSDSSSNADIAALSVSLKYKNRADILRYAHQVQNPVKPEMRVEKVETYATLPVAENF